MGFYRQVFIAKRVFEISQFLRKMQEVPNSQSISIMYCVYFSCLFRNAKAAIPQNEIGALPKSIIIQ